MGPCCHLCHRHCCCVACLCAAVACYSRPSAVLCRCSCHHLVVSMPTEDESFIVCPLIATLLSVMWHLPGDCSLAGAGDMVLQGCSCHYSVRWWSWVIDNSCVWWWRLVMVVMGSARWVLWMMMVV